MTGGPCATSSTATSDTAYFRAIAPITIASAARCCRIAARREGPLQAADARAGHPDLQRSSGLGWNGWPRRSAWRSCCARSGSSLVHGTASSPTLAGLPAARMAGVPLRLHPPSLRSPLASASGGTRASTAGLRAPGRSRDRGLGGDPKHHGRPRAGARGTHRVVWNGMEPLADPSPGTVDALPGVARRSPAGRSAWSRRGCTRRRDIAVLLEALSQVVREVPDVLVLCAGDGPHRARFEREAEARACRAPCASWASVATCRRCSRSRASRSCRSLAESFGFAALEAMSLGRAVVASRRVACPRWWRRRVGPLVDVGDAAGLARAMVRLLRDPALADTLGRAGRERARTFSSERMSARLRGGVCRTRGLTPPRATRPR